MTDDSTPPTEDKVVIFNKRFGSGNTSQPAMPQWHVVYGTIDKELIETYKQGYITSLMPFFVISANKDSKDINDTVFSVPCERIVIFERGTEQEEA